MGIMNEYLIGLFVLYWIGFGFLFIHFTKIYEKQFVLTDDLLNMIKGKNAYDDRIAAAYPYDDPRWTIAPVKTEGSDDE